MPCLLRDGRTLLRERSAKPAQLGFGTHTLRRDLGAGTVAALREHRRRQAAERLLVGPGWVDHDLVFADPAGGPMHPEAASMRFAKRVRRYGLPKLTVHGLRHYVAGWVMWPVGVFPLAGVPRGLVPAT